MNIFELIGDACAALGEAIANIFTSPYEKTEYDKMADRYREEAQRKINGK